MPVFKLFDEPIFPDPSQSEEDGLLAIGGDLSVERLLAAYSMGIFPWYEKGQPILWWSPDPRMVLFPDKFKRTKNLSRLVRKEIFTVKFDTDFEQVISKCGSTPRKNQLGTWITDEMKAAYINLYRLGYCHSVETYFEGELVGGLYGVSLGGVFFGESMFHNVSDASKVALWHLVERVKGWNFDFIDVQQETAHLRRMGAQAIDRKIFLILLTKSLKRETRKGSWNTNT